MAATLAGPPGTNTARQSRFLDTGAPVLLTIETSSDALADGVILVAPGGAGERNETDIARALDRDRQRPLVTGARTKLPSRLDLATFANVSPEPRDVLVVHVPDIVDTEGTNLPSRRITAAAGTASASATRTSGTGGTTWPPAITITVTFAPLALGSTEAGALRATFLGRPGTWATALSAVSILVVCHIIRFPGFLRLSQSG